jgi:C4-type Zn-finger protein
VPLEAVKCPACGGLTFRLIQPDDDAAPLGEVTRVFYKCSRCGSEITINVTPT